MPYLPWVRAIEPGMRKGLQMGALTERDYEVMTVGKRYRIRSEVRGMILRSWSGKILTFATEEEARAYIREHLLGLPDERR